MKMTAERVAKKNFQGGGGGGKSFQAYIDSYMLTYFILYIHGHVLYHMYIIFIS